MILEFSQQNNLENISVFLFSSCSLTIFTTSPVCSGASQRLGIFEDERLESVDILETFLGPTSDQETPADGENQNVFILCPFLFTGSTFSQVSRKKIFFSTIDTLSPWDGAINSVRSVKNAGERYNDRSLKILFFLRTEFVPQSLKG